MKEKIKTGNKCKEDIYCSIVESMPSCIKLFDLKGNIIFMNQFGMKDHRIENFTALKNFDITGDFPETDALVFKKSLKDAAQGKEILLNLQHKHDNSIWEVNVVPTTDPDGKIDGVFTISRDISQRKTNEEQLQQSELSLKKMNSALEEKIADLKKMQDLMIGREEKILELKNRISELEDKIKE